MMRKSVLFILLVSIAASGLAVPAPKAAEAQIPGVGDIVGGGGVAGEFLQAAFDFSELQYKEQFQPVLEDIVDEIGETAREEPEAFGAALIGGAIGICYFNLFGWDPCAVDHVLNYAGQAVLRALILEMTADIVNWINLGYPDGGPLFVQDFRTFGLAAADTASGYFLESLLTPEQLEAVCSPFRFDIIINLFQFRMERPKCTVADIVESVEALYNNFDGGWPSFIAITTQVNNNAFGSLLVRWDDLHARAIAAALGADKEAQTSQGFLAFKECIEYNSGPLTEAGTQSSGLGFAAGETTYGPSPQFGCAKYENKTPGAAILGLNNAEMQGESVARWTADSLNAIISAVIRQSIVNPMIRGITGAPTPEEVAALQARKNAIFSGGPPFNAEDDEGLDAAFGRATERLAAKQQSLSVAFNILSRIGTLATCDGQDRGDETGAYTAISETLGSEVMAANGQITALTSLRNKILLEDELDDMDGREDQARDAIDDAPSSDDIGAAQDETTQLQEALTGFDTELSECQTS